MVLSVIAQNKACEPLDERLFALGVLSAKVGYYHSNYIDVTVTSIEDMLAAKSVIKEHRTELSEIFAKAWMEQGGNIDPEYYGSGVDLYFQVYSKQERYINTLIRQTRDEISSSVRALLSRELIPKYFFCHSSNFDSAHSSSGYNVVFSDPDALNESKSEAQVLIKAECIRLLTKADADKMFEDRYFTISFFDVTSEHMYGLSRED